MTKRPLPQALIGRYLIASVPKVAGFLPVFWIVDNAWNSDPMQGTLFRDEQVAKGHINEGRDRGSFKEDVRPYSLERALSAGAA